MTPLKYGMSEYELKVLRDHASPIPTQMLFGAAYNSASEFLKGLGYLDGLPYTINQKGYDVLEAIDKQERVAAPQPAINSITRDDVDMFRSILANNDCMMPHEFEEYQRIATKSAIYPGKGTPFGLMYAALGLAEAGEVQNKVKKAFRDDDLITIEGCGEISFDGNWNELTPERRAQIVKELGGLLWYMSAVCNEIGATLSEVALTNLEELCSRTERDTLRGDGDDR